MKKRFPEYQGLNLSEVNKEMNQKWHDEDLFHLSVSTREGFPKF